MVIFIGNEMNTFILYIILKLTAIRTILVLIPLLILIIYIIYSVMRINKYDHDRMVAEKQVREAYSPDMGVHFKNEWNKKEKEVLKQIRKDMLYPSVLFVLLSIISALTPSTEQAVILYVVPKITTEKNIQKVEGELKDIYILLKQYFEVEFNSQKQIEKTNN